MSAQTSWGLTKMYWANPELRGVSPVDGAATVWTGNRWRRICGSRKRAEVLSEIVMTKVTPAMLRAMDALLGKHDTRAMFLRAAIDREITSRNALTLDDGEVVWDGELVPLVKAYKA